MTIDNPFFKNEGLKKKLEEKEIKKVEKNLISKFKLLQSQERMLFVGYCAKNRKISTLLQALIREHFDSFSEKEKNFYKLILPSLCKSF